MMKKILGITGFLVIFTTQGQELEIINCSTSPKTVELLEYRNVQPGGLFGIKIYEGLLAPGERTLVAHTGNEFMIDVQWGPTKQIEEEHYFPIEEIHH